MEEFDNLSQEEKKHLSKKIDPNKLEERKLSLNKEYFPYIDWNKLKKDKLIRLLCRNKDILDFINLKEMNFNIKEATLLLKSFPEYSEIIQINIQDNHKIQDLVELAKWGNNQKIIQQLDLKQNDILSKHIFQIIRAHDYQQWILESVELKNLDGYYISKILEETGDELIHLLDIQKINPLEWLRVLKSRPQLATYCFDEFENWDIYYLIELIYIIPESKNIILRNIHKLNKASTLAWEKLLIAQPNIFLEYCDLSIFNEQNWSRIIQSRPELEAHKL